VLDWRDIAALFCMALVVLGAAALSISANSFSIVRGKVIEKGIGILDFDGKPRITSTISVFILDDDRVFDIKRGTVVQYPVSESDADSVEVGSEIKLLVSLQSATVRILDHPSGSFV
jgi:hypothetical protein